MANLNRFYKQTLRAIGAPITPQNLEFMQRWQRHEGGWTNNTAAFNPFNTTYGPGTPINSVKVKRFGNFRTGVQSTAHTLQNGRYNNLLAGLRAGNPLQYDISGDLSTWVSGSPTKGLGYARSVMGGSGGGSPAPSTAAPQPIQGPNVADTRRQAAQGFIDFAMNYALTGRLEPQKLVAPRGTLKPPTHKQAKAKATSELAGGMVDKMLAAAHDQVGKPYVFGSGPSTDSFDCSDLIQYAYKQIGIDIPRTTYDQIKVGQPVKWGEFRPGDLIFSNNGGHVVMYVGGGKVIAAPYTGTVVQYQPVSRFKDSFVAARRIIQ